MNEPMVNTEIAQVPTAHPHQLVVEGLVESGEVMRGISSDMEQAVQALRLGQRASFGPLFVSAIDQLLSFLRFLGLAMAHLGERGAQLAAYQDGLNECIGQVFSAQKLGDAVLMADLIEFELLPLFEDWKSVRHDLISELQQDLFQGQHTA